MATLLEKIVDERVGQTPGGTVSLAVDRMAEEIACEALGDETFRRALRELSARPFAKALGPTAREWRW